MSEHRWFSFLNWSIVLQCCDSFCCTMKWISYMYTYIPPLWDPHPHSLSEMASRLSQSIKLSSLCYSRFPLAFCFIHGPVCMSVLVSQSIPPSPSPTVLFSACPVSTSMSLFLPCKQVYPHHFFRLHIYAIICNFFSLSGLLHSVWQPLGSSMFP